MNRDVNIPEPLLSGAPISVGTRQTTYWDVYTHDADVRYRIHFIDKVEFEFVTNPADRIVVATDHPLLIEHLEPEDALYISSKPDDSESTIEALSRLAEGHFWWLAVALPLPERTRFRARDSRERVRPSSARAA